MISSGLHGVAGGRTGPAIVEREPMAAHGNGQPAKQRNHYAEIVHPETLWQWAVEENPTLQFLHEAMQKLGRATGRPQTTPGVPGLPA